MHRGLKLDRGAEHGRVEVIHAGNVAVDEGAALLGLGVGGLGNGGRGQCQANGGQAKDPGRCSRFHILAPCTAAVAALPGA